MSKVYRKFCFENPQVESSVFNRLFYARPQRSASPWEATGRYAGQKKSKPSKLHYPPVCEKCKAEMQFCLCRMQHWT